MPNTLSNFSLILFCVFFKQYDVYFFVANYLEAISYLVYAIVLFDRFRSAKSIKYTVLFFYYVFATAIQFLGSFLSRYEMDNNWTYNLFFPVTIIVFSWYFHHLLFKKSNKLLVKILLAVNVFIFLKYMIFSNKFFGVYNSELFGFSFLTIVVYSLFYVNQLMTDIKDSNILLNFDFWLISSLLIYFLGGFFVVLFYYNSSIRQRAIVWTLLNIILFASSLISLVGNYKIRQQEISQKWQP